MSHDTDVTRRGISLGSATDEGLDVFFDGHRVWSFKSARDGKRHGQGWLVPWPVMLQPYLDGVVTVSIQPYGSDPVYTDEVHFGTAANRIAVTDAEGNWLVVDKGGRLQRGFSETDQSTKTLIVEAVDRVLTDLRNEAGLEAFLSFGCLLGAVRDGKMIGHDSDADVSYLSRFSHPYDIAREHNEAVRVMRRLGYTVTVMSSANFKIWTPLPGGRRCGIDVFGAYFMSGMFHMLGNLRGELSIDALLPTSTIMLEGRELVAPARPEEVLALTYGENWRVPDPSFKFHPPRASVRHMAGFHYGVRSGRRYWNEFYASPEAERVPTAPSLFARWVAERVTPGEPILDVGSGNGRDAVWLARRGFPVTALDFVGSAHSRAKRLQRQTKGADPTAQTPAVTFGYLNLNDLNNLLTTGARYAFAPQARSIHARFLLEVLSPTARTDFWRFASMVQRRGGQTFLEFRTHRSRNEKTVFEGHRRRYLNPSQVVEEIAHRGGTIVERVEGRDLAPFENENPDVCRLVVRWEK